MNQRAHHFLLRSFKTSISSSRSANSFFSRAFSVPICGGRFTSTALSCPKRLRQAYIVTSLTPCFLATSDAGAWPTSRGISTICSSEDRVFFMDSLSPRGHFLRFPLIRKSPEGSDGRELLCNVLAGV